MQKEKKHLLKCPAKNQLRIQLTSSLKKKEKETASVSKLVSQSSITSFITKEETVKAEIHWVLGSLPSNHSFNSCSTKTAVSAVFSGSTIAKQFSMGKIKCGY